jgi:hypothetical protein
VRRLSEIRIKGNFQANVPVVLLDNTIQWSEFPEPGDEYNPVTSFPKITRPGNVFVSRLQLIVGLLRLRAETWEDEYKPGDDILLTSTGKVFVDLVYQLFLCDYGNFEVTLYSCKGTDWSEGNSRF